MTIENAMRLGHEYKGDLSFYAIDKYLVQLRRLFTKHQRISIWACNGTKYTDPRGETYNLPDYHYTEEMFLSDIAKVEAKIDKILLLLGKGFKVEYQGDPRGYTMFPCLVKLYYRHSKRDGEHKDYKGILVDLEQGE